MQKIIFFSALILTSVAWGVDQETKEIAVSDFNRVVLTGRAVVHITQSDKESLTLSGSKSDLDEIKASIKYGQLVINHTKRGWFRGFFQSTEMPHYNLTVKDLDSITLKGSGEIYSDGPLETEELQLMIEGAGQVELDLKVKRIKAAIFGVGKVVLNGTADSQVIEIEGRGVYQGKDLISKKGRLMINGSGDAEINVRDELEVTINGSGNVVYLGKPKVNKHISGHGNVSNKQGEK